MRTALLLSICCASLTFGPTVEAKPPPPDRPPVAIQIPVPKVEWSSDGRQEASIDFHLEVNKHGRVTKVDLGDSFSSPSFETTAIAIAKHMRFYPALVNGQRVDWSGLPFYIYLIVRKNEVGNYPDFSPLYTTANAALDRKDYAAAKSEINDLVEHHVRLLYEYALAEESLYFAETGLGHSQAALRAITRATPTSGTSGTLTFIYSSDSFTSAMDRGTPSDNFLSGKRLQAALQNRFVDEAQLGRYREALQTFERLEKLGPLPDASIAKDYDNIKGVLTSNASFSIKLLLEDGSWSLRAPRRSFQVKDVVGHLNTITADCDRHIEDIAFQPATDLELPPDWGDCSLTFAGDVGTQLTLVENSDVPATTRTP